MKEKHAEILEFQRVFLQNDLTGIKISNAAPKIFTGARCYTFQFVTTRGSRKPTYISLPLAQTIALMAMCIRGIAEKCVRSQLDIKFFLALIMILAKRDNPNKTLMFSKNPDMGADLRIIGAIFGTAFNRYVLAGYSLPVI